MALALLALIFMYKWLSFRKRKMPFPFMLTIYLILFLFSVFVVNLMRVLCFHFIAVGAIASTCMMLPSSGACGDDNSSSSEGVGKLPLPSTTSSPVPSISSRGASWIDEFFGPEVSSSAPAQGQRQQEEGGLFQPPQPAPSSSSTGVGPAEQQASLLEIRAEVEAELL